MSTLSNEQVLPELDTLAAGKRGVPWVWGMLCLLPGVATLLFILHYSVDALWWDEWMNADVLLRFAQHQLTFAGLIAQHNDSRSLFPRLWLLFITRFGHWNQRAETLASLGVACLTALLSLRLALDTCGRAGTTLVAALLGSGLIFSWVQWEAWIWGMCLELFLPVCFLYASVVIMKRDWPFRVRLPLCALVAFMAQFSFSDGVFVWIVLTPVIFCGKGGSGKIYSVIGGAVFWIAAAAASCTLYFHNYANTNSWPSLKTIWENRSGEIDYALTFLGYPITGSGGTLFSTETVGIILLTAFVGALLVLVLPSNRVARIWRAMPWVMIAGFVLICGMAAAVMRIGLGINEVYTPRYAVTEAHFAIATIFLVLMASRELQWRLVRRDSQFVMAVPLVLAALAGAGGLLFLNANNAALPNAADYDQKALHAMAFLQFCKIMPDLDAGDRLILTGISSDSYFLKRIYEMDRYGYFRPRLLDEEHFAQLVKHAQRIVPGSSEVRGGFDIAQRQANGDIDLGGWSWNERTDTAAAAVIFTYHGDDQREHPLAMALDYDMGRPDLSGHFGGSAPTIAGWSRHLRATDLAMKQRLVVRAWVYDPVHCQLWAVPNILTVPAMSPAQ